MRVDDKTPTIDYFLDTRHGKRITRDATHRIDIIIMIIMYIYEVRVSSVFFHDNMYDVMIDVQIDKYNIGSIIFFYYLTELKNTQYLIDDNNNNITNCLADL